mmetsp:Transcript_26188/g.104747  ORF Transcript_26188/g.104747 Transcript_26188/m.104747 type:complete len:279 (+) Transcript_26188:1962-2798(+)
MMSCFLVGAGGRRRRVDLERGPHDRRRGPDAWVPRGRRRSPLFAGELLSLHDLLQVVLVLLLRRSRQQRRAERCRPAVVVIVVAVRRKEQNTERIFFLREVHSLVRRSSSIRGLRLVLQSPDPVSDEAAGPRDARAHHNRRDPEHELPHEAHEVLQNVVLNARRERPRERVEVREDGLVRRPEAEGREPLLENAAELHVRRRGVRLGCVRIAPPAQRLAADDEAEDEHGVDHLRERQVVGGVQPVKKSPKNVVARVEDGEARAARERPMRERFGASSP